MYKKLEVFLSFCEEPKKEGICCFGPGAGQTSLVLMCCPGALQGQTSCLFIAHLISFFHDQSN